MNILKFYREGKCYWHCLYTEDKKFEIQREIWGPYKKLWHVFRLEKDGIYHTIFSPYFQNRVDAILWLHEHYYPDWKLQKKLIKKED